MQLEGRTNHYGTKSDGRWGQEPQDTWRCSDCGIMGQWKSTEPAMCGPWPPITHFSKYTAGTDFGSATGTSRPCKWCSKTESEHFDADKFCSQFEYQYGEFCCICYAHRFGCDQWCGQCAARWKTLRDFMEAHEPELSSAKLARLRSQVGSSLQHAFDLLASRVLLQKQDGIDIFVALLMDEGTWLATLRDGNGIVSAFDDDGRLTLNISLARSAAGLEGALPPKAGKGSRCVPNWFAMRQIAPGLSQLDGLLTTLDVSGHPHLRTVPVNELCAIKSLASFSCDRCPRLFAPPPEIACQGGDATMKYLRIASKKAGGVVNKKIELILVGKSESGKTSVAKMLMQGKCDRIPHESRTVGVELMDWDVSEEADGLEFSVKDLAGQDVAGVWNQLFLVKRAIYVLVWRVIPRAAASQESLREVSEMVSTWLDSLQMRVPGAHVLLVATHVDSATEDEVDEQCFAVKTVAQEKIKLFSQDDEDAGIPSLILWREGDSFRVDCLCGAGAEELKKSLFEMARCVPFFAEQIPASYHALRTKIRNRRFRTPWLTWAAYAEMAQQCGVSGDHIVIASRVLHDNCALKFFGKYPSSSSSRKARDNGTRVENSEDLVYIDVQWIVDVLKGLIRHNRDSLLTFFASEPNVAEKWTLWRHAMRLAIHGILHRDLMPFLWPAGGTSLSKRYWEWASSQEEGLLWPRPVVLSADGYSQVISVLLGCDVLQRVSSDEYVAPALLAGTHHYRLDAHAFALPQVGMCHRTISVPDNLPDGFLSRLLTKIRLYYTHMDFSAFAAALYDRGRKAQIFLTHGRTEGGLTRRERPYVTMHFFTSTEKQMEQIIKHVDELGLFFPGMCSIDRTGQVSTTLDKTVVKTSDETSGKSTEITPVQVQIIEYCSAEQVQQAKRARQLQELQQESESVHLREQMEESERLLKSQKMSVGNQIKEIILQSNKATSQTDNLLTVAVGDPALDEHEWGSADTSAMRVILICMDRNIISTLSPHNLPLQRFVQKFQAAVNAGLAIIPLICPGYNVEDYACWWPRYLPEMKQHSIFFDCRDMLSRQQIRDLQFQANEERMKRAPPVAKQKMKMHETWSSAVKEKLLNRINKYLLHWRGSPPDLEALTAAVDRVVCPQCSEQQALQPHIFSRSGCQSKLEKLTGNINEINNTVRAAATITDKNKATQALSELLEEQCSLGHRMALPDLLTVNTVVEVLPCPQCLQSEVVPPFCFDRQDILTVLRAPSTHPSEKVCLLCERAGRPSRVSLFDIMLPEIIVSYDREARDEVSSTYSTAKLVRAMRETIEHSADVCSWSCEQGQSGELQRFIDGCTVVLIFLNDAYCASNICAREFLLSARSSKYLIPVLMPGGAGHEGGWTGPGPEDKNWWHHALICSTCKDPDTGNMFSWSPLGQFSPIDGRALTGIEDKRWHEVIVPEIVKRVQSRFHRGEHIQHMQKQYIMWRKRALLDTFTAREGELHKLREEANALFQRLDVDGSGEIDKSELMKGFPQLDEETADLLIADVDLDLDGSISFDELWSVIESLVTAQ